MVVVPVSEAPVVYGKLGESARLASLFKHAETGGNMIKSSLCVLMVVASSGRVAFVPGNATAQAPAPGDSLDLVTVVLP